MEDAEEDEQVEGKADAEEAAQQSNEEMPDIALLGDDAADHEEFDYADGQQAEDYDDQVEQPEFNAGQGAAQSEESSAIRSV